MENEIKFFIDNRREEQKIEYFHIGNSNGGLFIKLCDRFAEKA